MTFTEEEQAALAAMAIPLPLKKRTLPRYYVQHSNIGWQVRDREKSCVVEWPGGWTVYKSRAAAGRKARELNDEEAT